MKMSNYHIHKKLNFHLLLPDYDINNVSPQASALSDFAGN